MALVVGAVVLLLAACAPGGNELVGTAAENGRLAGFWFGLWHGLITPVTFVVSLFTDTVNVYEVHNSGGWYDFGFVLGLSATFGGGAGSAASNGPRRARR